VEIKLLEIILLVGGFFMESSIILAVAGYSLVYTMVRMHAWNEVENGEQVESNFWNKKYIK